MTVQKSSSESEEDFCLTQIDHETEEKCREYMSNSENMMRFEDTHVEEIRLIGTSQAVRILGPPTVLRCLPWKLFTCQNFCNNNNKLYLLCSLVCDVKTDAFWSCAADLSISLLNRVNPDENVTVSAKFLYSHKSIECTFPEVIQMKELVKPDSPYVKRGCFKIRVSLSISPPKGFIWDSKKLSGYVGLVNQGATCYLNSLLQILYFTNPLKKIIFKAPTEIDNRVHSVVLALQYTFMDLCYSETVVNTKKLTDSFGWGPNEVYVQRDAQEMCRLLIDHIETKIKGTAIEKEISKLLEGNLVVRIECINVPFKSESSQTFYDVQLNVKNMNNIYDAFDHYCSSETLEKDNKYNAEGYGFQDALKRTCFKKFPPFLHLHLLRFVVNCLTYNYEKVNDRIEYPRELRLGKYLVEGSDQKDDVYYLQSVLVHCGNSNGGHYIAFISPNCDNHWLKFDDDIVSIATETEAIEGNFGSNEIKYGASIPTAYMLMYVNAKILSDPNYQFSEAEIPDYLKELYSEENDAAVQHVTYQNNAQSYLTLRFMMCESLFTCYSTRTANLNNIESINCTFPADFDLNSTAWFLAKQMNIDVNSIRLWLLKSDLTSILRPTFICGEILKHPVKKIMERYRHPFFVEHIQPDTPTFDRSLHVMIFLHYFVPAEQKIFFLGFYQIMRDKSLKDIFEEFVPVTGVYYHDEMLFYRETTRHTLKLLESHTCPVNDLFEANYDTEWIVFQTTYERNVSIQDASYYPFQYAHHYLLDKSQQLTVSFHNICSPHDSADFIVDLSSKMFLSHMLSVISNHCRFPPSNIRLFKRKGINDVCLHVRSDFSGNLLQLFNSINRFSDRQKLFYAGLPYSVQPHDSEILYFFEFQVQGAFYSLPLFFEPNLTVDYSTLMSAVNQAIEFQQIPYTNPLRLISFDAYIINIIQPHDKISSYLDEVHCTKMRIEETSEDQLKLIASDTLVTVNIKIKENQQIFMQRGFLIKIGADFTCENIFQTIESRGIINIISISFFHMTNKKNTRIYKKPQLFTFKGLSLEPKPHIYLRCLYATDFTILVEVSDSSLQIHKNLRTDSSIKIYSQ